jgi:hypothetical protein
VLCDSTCTASVSFICLTEHMINEYYCYYYYYHYTSTVSVILCNATSTFRMFFGDTYSYCNYYYQEYLTRSTCHNVIVCVYLHAWLWQSRALLHHTAAGMCVCVLVCLCVCMLHASCGTPAHSQRKQCLLVCCSCKARRCCYCCCYYCCCC